MPRFRPTTPGHRTRIVRRPQPPVMPYAHLFIGDVQRAVTMLRAIRQAVSDDLARYRACVAARTSRRIPAHRRRSANRERLPMSDQGEETASVRGSPPYLLYLGSATDDLSIKTARGLAHWRPEQCLGQHRRPDCTVTLGLPDLEIAQGRARGAHSMVIGAANAGGVMDAQIIADAIAALDAGLHVVSGLHQRLRDQPDIVAAARRNGSDAVRCTRSPTGHRRRHRQAASRAAPAYRRHRLLGRQDVYGACAGTVVAAARLSGGFPRHGADRHPHRRLGHTDRCGGRGFRLRRGGSDLARTQR